MSKPGPLDDPLIGRSGYTFKDRIDNKPLSAVVLLKYNFKELSMLIRNAPKNYLKIPSPIWCLISLLAECKLTIL